MECSPPGSSVHGIFLGKNTGVGLSFASLGDLPDPEIEISSLSLAGRFFTTESPGKPLIVESQSQKMAESSFPAHAKSTPASTYVDLKLLRLNTFLWLRLLASFVGPRAGLQIEAHTPYV